MGADKLYSEAMDDAGLAEGNLVTPVVIKSAKRGKPKLTRPQLELTIKHPRTLLEDLSKGSLDDVECFSKMLDHLESDISTMKLRANAWATGDIEGLRALPITDPGAACIEAFMQAPALQARGFGDSAARMRKIWLSAAEAALAKNASTFALSPMSQMLKSDGLLADLRAKGYQIEEP